MLKRCQAVPRLSRYIVPGEADVAWRSARYRRNMDSDMLETQMCMYDSDAMSS